MKLSERFDEALAYASELHRGQVRKGSSVPYVSHVLAVAAIVLEDGGDEDEAIAALLHDAAEDAGGRATLDEIRRRFGDRVAGIVEECSDTLEDPKPPWQERKDAFIASIATASTGALRVELADKLHNVRSILADYEKVGEDIWDRFTTGRAGTRWYYATLIDSFAEVVDEASELFASLRQVVDRLLLISARCPECGGSRVVEIIYGLPTEETFQRSERGDVALGGCMVGPDEPRFQCSECATRFGRLGDL